jgi:SsrA-binding protein
LSFLLFASKLLNLEQNCRICLESPPQNQNFELGMSVRSLQLVTMPHVYVNRKASFEYELLERFEAGIELRGTEIKSIRVGGLDFRDSYARFTKNELFLENLYIPPFAQASYNNHEPSRNRKLLLHRKELDNLRIAITHKGLTIVPVRLYMKSGRAKLEIAIAKGKKLWDKREAEKTRDAKREMERYR